MFSTNPISKRANQIMPVLRKLSRIFDGFFRFLLVSLAIYFVGVTLLSMYDEDPERAQFLAYLIGGGAFFLQIAVFNFRAIAAEKTAAAMQKTAELTEIGNIAERFKNSIEHLGHSAVSVRLGGIYALHHLAQEVNKYNRQVFDILCAHIRETTSCNDYKPRIVGKIKIKEPQIEIKIILDLLFVNSKAIKNYKNVVINFEHAKLQGANFVDASLPKAFFSYADLEGIYFMRAELQNARFTQVNMKNASLDNANLQGASLFGVNFQYSNLKSANLQNAWLEMADLRNSKNLKIEQLLGAKTLYMAKLPKGMEEEIRRLQPDLLEEPAAEPET